MLRALIISPYPAMRAGLRALIAAAGSGRVTVAAEADTLEGGLEAARAAQVVVYDLALELDDEMTGLWRLRRQAPAAAILALADTASDGPRRMVSALQAGARGCLNKTADGAELVEALEGVAQGEPVLPRDTTAALLDHLRGEAGGETLTRRETEVLQYVAAGLTNKAIAVKVGISEHTVKFHLGSVMSKFGAASRAEAVATAMRRGLISV